MIDDDLHCLGIFYHLHHHHQAHQQKLISINSTFRSAHIKKNHTHTYKHIHTNKHHTQKIIQNKASKKKYTGKK